MCLLQMLSICRLAFDSAFVRHLKEVLSFYNDLYPPFTPPLWALLPFSLVLYGPLFRPLRAGTRQSLLGEVSALADMSAKPLTCWRPTLNRPATGLRPAAVGRLQGLFGHLGALTSCA